MFFGMFVPVLSARNGTQKRNHHSRNEPRMEQYEDRSCGNERRPQPSPRATPQAESLPGLRPLHEHAESLRKKIGRRQPVSRSGGNGNDQIVQEAGGEKGTECSGSRSETLPQGLEHPRVRECAKSEVPAPAPQF